MAVPSLRANGQKIKASWFNEIRDALQEQNITVETNSTATGANQTLALPAFAVRLTNISLTSIAGIVAPSTPQNVILTNLTGVDLVIANDSTATAANRILTGTGANLDFLNGSSIGLYYDNISSRWRVFGGSGGGGGGSNVVVDDLTLTAGDTLVIDTGELVQTFRVQGNSGAVSLSNTPFGTTPPVDGTIIYLIGNSDDNTVTITANDAADGCVGNFSSLTLHKFETAKFIWNEDLDRYVLI
jgi:hypothetical protein